MIPYEDKSGKGGIDAYSIGTSWIRIKFKSRDDIYTYSYKKAGRKHTEKMKALAKKGEGLTTYINQYTKDLFD